MNKHYPQMSLELAREIARQGDKRLDAILSIATAADLRATTLCGIFGAASVGVGAAVLGTLTSAAPPAALIAAGAATGFFLFIASVLAALAGVPRNFFIAGGDPDTLREWSWDKHQWRNETQMLDATAQRQAESIQKDRKILENGTAFIRWAIFFGLASPLAGVASYFFFKCLS